MAEQNSETLTMAEWESKGYLMFVDYVPNKKLTSEEVRELELSSQTVAIQREYREQWLKDNGYEVTRENLMDWKLPTVSKE